MERIQSTWQHVVQFNLSDSGVRSLRFVDLLSDPAAETQVLGFPIAYSQTNGTQELREAIAAMYRGASAANVLVTTGSSEANFLVMWGLAERGTDIVHMVPSYLQIWGLAKTFGVGVTPLPIEESRGWQINPENLKRVCTRNTAAIAVCNPNNPTGAVMGAAERKGLIDACEEHRVWLLSDEVFQGAERTGGRTASLWDPNGRTIITNGLSKAYGLPGLRIGWIVAPEEMIARFWSHHDYTTIAPTYVSDRLAQLALEPRRRNEILARTRTILTENYRILELWARELSPALTFVPPTAGAVCFLRYSAQMTSSEFASKLIHEKSTLVVPGEHFGLDGYFRVCYGSDPAYLAGGLARVGSFVGELSQREPRTK
jgi:hypothetical protein